MKKNSFLVLISTTVFVSGCASIDFNAKDGEGLTYYDPMPYLFVSTTDKCISTATVINVPATKKAMKFSSGYGSSDLSASFANNMIVAIGQKNDSKIPESITSIAALATATLAGPAVCKPSAVLYPLVDGVPDPNSPINFSVQ